MRAIAARIVRALFATVAAVAFAAAVQAQDAVPAGGPGTVAGRVSDALTGMAVGNVSVVLLWPSTGEDGEPRRETQITAEDGSFEFASVTAGSYRLEFSKSGYRSSTMTDFIVKPDQPNRADFPLPPIAAAKTDDPEQLEEFVVTAEKIEDLMTVRLESDQLLSVVGAEEFSKFAASDVGEVLERVAGINVVEGQFAIIRGLEDRYSNTLYNGAPIPSPDPDSQSVQLDLFPSEVVGNLSVAKTFSPELPSNSSGGAIDIITHEYPDDVEVSFKAGTGWNQNAQNEFLQQEGHTDVGRLVNGLKSTGTVNGLPVYPDINLLKAEGFRFVGGNPVGVESTKTGSFFEDLGDVLESDYVGSLAGKQVFGGREFRLKAVVSQETDYGTATGFEEEREPRGPVPGEPTLEFINEPPYVITKPGKIEKSGDLTLGRLSLTDGKYDLTISQKEQQRTGFGALGFDLDDEGSHKIDASFFYTKLKEDAVQLQSGGYLPGFDYFTVSQQQLVNDIDPTKAFQGVTAPGSFIAGSIRDGAFKSPTLGALAFTEFNQSTSFETDRDLWVVQVNGDHRFDPLPGLHFSWAWNRAKTTQDESALGMGYFYEPCGYSDNVPCPTGIDRIAVPTTFPTGADLLGPGKYAVRNDLLLSANSIEETADFYRLDGEYEIAFSENSRFTLAGGGWFEQADRTVRSAFLESPGVAPDLVSTTCGGGFGSTFVCFDPTAVGLGGAVFNDLAFQNGNLAGLRSTTNEASRDINAWHLRGKWTFWDKLDLLGGLRGEKIFIQSLNDPFVVDPVTGNAVTILGGPQTYPTRFLFFDRLDNPFTSEVSKSQLESRGSSFVYNDQLLGNPVAPGPCVDDDGSIPGIQCVDLVNAAQLQNFLNGTINERRLLPSAAFTFRPIDGLAIRGAWSETVARPSFRELGYYVTVAPGSDDLVVGNPNLQLSDVESWDARLEYVWGHRGDLFAVSYFQKKIQTPIEAIILRDPTNFEISSNGALYQTFFNNPNTADLSGVEAELRKSFDFIEPFFPSAPDWLEYFSVGGNYTWIDAEVGRTEAELARARPFFGAAEGDEVLFAALAPTRRLFNQPEWIANADVTFDHPGWGLRLTVAYFAISNVLDAAGSATLGADGSVLSYTPDRYVGSFMDLRATIAKTFELPNSLGEITFRATGKNLTDSARRLIYDTNQTNKEIALQQLRLGRDYSFSLTFRRRF